jgi:hypothetical protein
MIWHQRAWSRAVLETGRPCSVRQWCSDAGHGTLSSVIVAGRAVKARLALFLVGDVVEFHGGWETDERRRVSAPPATLGRAPSTC